ncbi:pheromone receptor Rcb2 B43 [Mycena galericulata]|nr:pheromone receptor Rcb2 B43 [Mycena galericulata]
MRPELAPVAFLSAFSLVLPLPWHWRARNVATLSIIFWLFISNMIYAIDAVIWSGNVFIVGTVWCDITTKLIIGSNIALPAACFCICVHLEQVASVRAAQTMASDKRRRQRFELLMCFALPVVYMALHYIVQGHRFDIIEDYGCRPTVYFSIPSLFLISIPPILLAVASLILGGLALRHFILRRVSFAAHLDASHSALTTSRYLRLMLMSVLEMIWSISVTSYTLWFTTISIPIRPYTSWASVHSDFSRVDTYPTLFMPELVVTTYYFLWWLVPISTLAFVAMFAFGRDAVEEYKNAFFSIRDVLLRRKATDPASKKAGFGTLSDGRAPRGALELAKYPASKAQADAALPAYAPPTPPTPSKYRAEFDDLDYDTVSEASSHLGPALSYQAPTVITYLGDSAPSTPSTVAPTSSPAPRPGAPRSTRPITYPSFDAARRAAELPTQ